MARGGPDVRRTRPSVGGPDRPTPGVRDLTRGGRPFSVEFRARASFDFLVSLTLGDGADSDLLPEDRAWLRDAWASLTDAQRDAISSTFGERSEGLFNGLVSLVVEREDLGRADALAATAASMSAVEITGLMLADVLPGVEGRALADRALSGDAAAMAQVEEVLASIVGTDKCEGLVRSLRDPGPAWERAQESISAWLPHFQAIAPRVERLQGADLASHAGDLDPSDPGALIERVTGGLRWLPDPTIRRVLLAPTYFSRPFNYIYQGADWRLFCYPIADSVLEAADRSGPPGALVRLHKALGDATRMRILRLLTDRDWYLTELATQLDLSKPTTKHHLALLRAAGLVTVTEAGNLTYYSLRRERIEHAGAELLAYLA